MHVILTVNAGSSSLKFQVFAKAEGLPLLATGKVEEIGTHPVFSARLDNSQPYEVVKLPDGSPHTVAFKQVLDWIKAKDPSWKIIAAAHRVVHGGPNVRPSPERVTDAVYADLESLIPLAPLHQPHNLNAIKVLKEIQPDMLQYACYDTAFHSVQDKLQYSFALPKDWRDKGVRRYGFHGLSYKWISRQLSIEHPELSKGRVVVAHLGNGSSLTAIQNGKSVATSMGMTALDGVPMGTRTGQIDAGAVFFLLRHSGLTTDQVEKRFYSESGLKGLSGISSDVRTLMESDSPDAAFALNYFAQKVSQQIASLAVTMGGIDGLVFTGGIGENAAALREKILAPLAFLNIPKTLVIPTNEERMMAMDTVELVASDLAKAA